MQSVTLQLIKLQSVKFAFGGIAVGEIAIE
jgi:hypothetical protein